MKFLPLVRHMRNTRKLVNRATIRYMHTLYRHALGAKAVMEIGIGPEAVSGTTFAAAMDGGALYSLDIDADRPSVEQMCFVMESLGVRWSIAHGDSINIEFTPPQLDLLYIDGDHGETHIESDFRRFSPFVKKGGVVIFDDIQPDTNVLGLEGRHIPYDGKTNGHFIYQVPR